MQQEQGLTFRELVRYFFKRKVLTIVSFLVITILALGALVVFQKPSSNYKSTFMISFKDIENNHYPDGSFFSFKSIIGKEAIDNTKASSDQFDSIDTEAMYKNNALSIENTDASTNINKQMYSLTFELKVPASYFESFVQAAQFVQTLIESSTYDKVNDFYDSYKIPDLFYNIDEDTDYIVILSKINETLNLLTDEIKGAIEVTSPDYKYDGNKTLKMLLAEWKTYVRSLNLDAIEQDYNTHMYDRKNKDTTAKAFEDKVQEVISGLKNRSIEIQKARNEANKETNFIFYEDNQIITESRSGMGMGKATVLSVAIGLVGAIILVSCYGAYENFEPVKSERPLVSPRFGKKEVKVKSDKNN